MDVQTAARFFGWCTIINGGILILWALFMTAAPGWVHATQKRWFPLSEDTHRAFMYGFLALFKIQFFFLNLAPYIALRIVAS